MTKKITKHEAFELYAAMLHGDSVKWDQFVDAVFIDGQPWFLASDVQRLFGRAENIAGLLLEIEEHHKQLLDAEETGEQRYYISEIAFARLLLRSMMSFVA
jgi:prophage antirepressor-like protein